MDKRIGCVFHGLEVGEIICPERYFASVEAASVLFDHGLRIIGDIKHSFKKYPLQYLGNIKMEGRADHKTMLTIVCNRAKVD